MGQRGIGGGLWAGRYASSEATEFGQPGQAPGSPLLLPAPIGPQAGSFANEEKPQEIVGIVQSFLTALQLEGYGLGGDLVVGE